MDGLGEVPGDIERAFEAKAIKRSVIATLRLASF